MLLKAFYSLQISKYSKEKYFKKKFGLQSCIIVRTFQKLKNKSIVNHRLKTIFHSFSTDPNDQTYENWLDRIAVDHPGRNLQVDTKKLTQTLLLKS